MNDALFRVEVREAFTRLTKQGWTDAIRTLHPDAQIYTFWDFFRNAYARDAGLRIDHLLLSPAARDRLVAAGVDRDVRGWEKAERSRADLDHNREQLVSHTTTFCLELEANTNARRPAAFPRDVALAPSAARQAPSLDRRQT